MNQTLQQYLLKNDIDKNGFQIPTLYQCSLRLSIALPSWKFISRNCHFKCRRSTSIPLNHMPLLRNLGEKDFNFVIPVSFNNVTMTIFWLTVDFEDIFILAIKFKCNVHQLKSNKLNNQHTFSYLYQQT